MVYHGVMDMAHGVLVLPHVVAAMAHGVLVAQHGVIDRAHRCCGDPTQCNSYGTGRDSCATRCNRYDPLPLCFGMLWTCAS